MPSEYTNATGAAAVAKSPFFRPSNNNSSSTSNNGNGRFFRTPGGTTRRKKTPPIAAGATSSDKDEHKSTVLGCASNLVNAIVGSGIVGLPYAIQKSGFVPGIVLVLFCALLTERSLRLLIETAKHSNVPSYETVAEAAYGKFGFYFIATNMFIMAYGAMLSYLMIVKDTFSSILGIDEGDLLRKRAVLVVVSSLVMLPLSCQRDMADLAKTSKMNVCFDLMIVLIVVYMAVHRGDYYEDTDYENIAGAHYVDYDVDSDNTSNTNTANDLWKVRWDTIFVGLGVLSFAFVCQHSSFIIAGSLEKPTKERWSTVTKIGVGLSASLALLMGIAGYVGFGSGSVPISGNILNGLPQESTLAQVAKALLGTTMLFVYPMESFVARHACVVLFFEGRKAHDGDDASVLSRRDRRITLTVVLYLSAVLPAALFEKLGDVLAVTGAVGGSNLSYIGPGIVYLGIHGGRFLELSKSYFGPELCPNSDSEEEEKSTPVVHNLHAVSANSETNSAGGDDDDEHGILRWCCRSLKTMLWYISGMPIWTTLASIGKGSLTTHVTEMALKSPHPIRIGNVRYARAKVRGGKSYTRVVMLQKPHPAFGSSSSSAARNAYEEPTPLDDNDADDDDDDRFGLLTTKLLRADSMPKLSNDSYKMQTTKDGTIVALPPLALYQPRQKFTIRNNFGGDGKHASTDYGSIDQKIGAMAVAANQDAEGDDIAIEDDPQGDPPTPLDFAIAIFYIIFGIIAMIAGLYSIF